MAGIIFDLTAKFRVTRDFETDAMTSWLAPYTGSEHCTIPAGTILALRDFDVSEPTEQVRYEIINPPKGEAYITTLFPAAAELGLEDPSQDPDKWERVVYLGSSLICDAENHAELEPQLIPESTRTSPKYGSYWFQISLTAIGDGIEFLPDGRDIAFPQGTPFHVDEPFDAFGLRSDGVAAHCKVRNGAVLTARHSIERRHLVSGWERVDGTSTWWMSNRPNVSDASAWTPADRVCPCAFLADCDPRGTESVEADRPWEALLVPTDLIGKGIRLA